MGQLISIHDNLDVAEPIVENLNEAQPIDDNLDDQALLDPPVPSPQSPGGLGTGDWGLGTGGQWDVGHNDTTPHTQYINIMVDMIVSILSSSEQPAAAK